MNLVLRISLISAFLTSGLTAANAFPVVANQQANHRQGQVEWNAGFADPTADPFFGAAPTSATSLFAPGDVHHDAKGERLIVADTLNRRVLIFDAAGGSDFSSAPLMVLGQPTLDRGGADPSDPYGHSNTANAAFGCEPGVNACGVRRPFAVAFDHANQRLFVADPDNRRVLVWNLNTAEDGSNADWVLGQADMTSDVLNDGCDGGAAVSACGLAFPMDLAFDPARQWLFVADSNNHRVLIYDATDLQNGMAAIAVIGQSDLQSNQPDVGCLGGAAGVSACGLNQPGALAYDGANQLLYVGDTSNHRVLRFDVSTLPQDAVADRVLGQPDPATGTVNTDCGGGVAGEENTNACGFGAFGMGLAVSSDTLYVSDAANHRVMTFDTPSLQDGQPADGILGQATFNAGYDPTDVAFGGRTSRTSFVTPQGLSYDADTDRLFVADVGNHRVMVFGANVGGTAVEAGGDVESSETVAEDGGISIHMTNSLGHAISVTFPEGTAGPDADSGIQLALGYIAGDPNSPGILIAADLPPGETKSITLPVTGNRLCIVDKDIAIAASFPNCSKPFRVRVPRAGRCRDATVDGELGDNPNDPDDPRGRHTVTACTADDGESVTVSGLLHTFVGQVTVPETDLDPEHGELGDETSEHAMNNQVAGQGCQVSGARSSGLAIALLVALLVGGVRRRR